MYCVCVCVCVCIKPNIFTVEDINVSKNPKK